MKTKREKEIEIRRRLWAIGMAYKAFTEASEAFGGLLSLGLTRESPIFDAVCCGGTIAYSRPFKTKKKENLWKPDEKMIPKSLRYIHLALILFRDKILAHSDLTGTENVRGQANQLEFVVENSLAQLKIVKAKFKHDKLKEMHALCRKMQQKTARLLQIEMNRLLKSFYPDGHYVLSLNPTTNALIPFNDDGFDTHHNINT